MKKTLIASAILFATSGVAMAATDYIWQEPVEGATEIDVATQTFEVLTEKNYLVKSTTNNNSKSVFAKNIELKNDQTVWAINDATAGNNAKLTVLSASGAGKVVTNAGTIYLDGSLGNAWGTKALYADKAGKAINAEGGLIYVRNANGIQAGSGTPNATLINNGVIVHEGIGSAIDVANGNGHIVENNGTLILRDTTEGDYFGIRVSDGVAGAEITNSGTIAAVEGAYAIYIGENVNDVNNITATDTTVTLKGNSHITGLVGMNQTSALNVDGVKGESIQLQTLKDDGANPDDAMAITYANGADTVIEQGTTDALDVGTLNVDATSNAQFKLTQIAESADAKVLTVKTVEGDGNVAVGYAGNVSDELLQGADAKLLTSGVSLGGETVESVTVDQGLSGDALVVDKNGNVKTVQANSLITSAQDVAVASALMWRDQLSSLSDRMGTLRTMPGEVGSWARYTNGRLDGNDIEHDFNTIEVGFDKKINDTVALGASFAYTKGDTDLIAGTADNNTYTGGLYATYMNESNCFFDAMLKIGRIDAEYDLMTSAGAESADYMMTGTIFGIEAGHRWNVQNFYVEPALQVTYSHIRPASYTSSIERQVKYEAMESLIAKVGVTGGMTFAEKGAAFAAVSYNHDFMGDVEGRYTHNSITRTFEDELDDNWGEAKLGASYQVTNGLNAFADVATTFGGDIDQKWRVNIGARYVF